MVGTLQLFQCYLEVIASILINIIKHLLIFLKFGKEEVELATKTGKKFVNIDLTTAEKKSKTFVHCIDV